MEVHSLTTSSDSMMVTSKNLLASQSTSASSSQSNQSSQVTAGSPRLSASWQSSSNVVHRWLWQNTSNEKSVSDSFNLQSETFYFIRQICFAISLITWTMSQLESKEAILTNFQYLTEWGVDLSVIYFGLSLRIMKD